jgi:hypothetical protein
LNGPGPTTSGRPLAPVGPLAASAPEHRQADAALLADVARALRGPVPEPILALLARAQAGEAPATLREEVAAMRDLELRVLLTEWLDAREGLQQSPAAERPPAGPGGAGTLRRR